MSEPKNKIKLAIGVAASCSGCDVAILDTGDKIFDIISLTDIVFWPTAMDFKLSHLEAIKEKEIDITLYHGAIRNSENEHLAHLLSERSKVMIAFGSCACFGGIPGLCNLTDTQGIFETVYKDTSSTDNPEFITPKMDNGILPQLYDEAKALHQVIDVDYYLPGCPPSVELIEKLLPIIGNFIEKGELPPKGTVIASEKTLCDECNLGKKNKMISKILRTYEAVPDPTRCLLEQGIICMGPATRGGCGTKCINGLIPCRGCMGPASGVVDQGAKMLSAIASILGLEDEKEATEKQVEELIDQIDDPLGTFYCYTLPVALINKKTNRK